jgi:hypothetical protein
MTGLSLEPAKPLNWAEFHGAEIVKMLVIFFRLWS